MSMFLIISTIWAVIALVLLIVAWRLARAGRIALRRNIMILLTVGARVFIINYIFVQRYAATSGHSRASTFRGWHCTGLVGPH